MIFEIAGLPHSGKALLAKAIAHRYEIETLRFPVLNLKAFTGTAIYKGLRNPHIIGLEPHWWSLMWAAHYTEYQSWLTNNKPKILVNYTTSYKAWNKAGCPVCSDFVKHLSQPSKIYYVDAKKKLENLPDDPCFFDEYYISRYRSYFSSLRDKRLLKVESRASKHALTSAKLNDIAEQIGFDIEKNYGLKPKNISLVPLSVR